jgi:hypothetical protein
MSYQRSYDELDVVDKPGCVHLRSKAMYVTGKLEPTDQDEVGSHSCWCNRTQHFIGPDERAVERTTCIAGRTCYRATR